MDFSWEELTPSQRARHYADWHAGKGLIGGDPRRRPNSDVLPPWAMDRFIVRALALDDSRVANGERFRRQIASACPLEIEIGFGRGDFLLDRSARMPERLFIGFEVRTKAVRLALRRLENQGLENLWLSDDDSAPGWACSWRSPIDAWTRCTCFSPTPGGRRSIRSSACFLHRSSTCWRPNCVREAICT